MKKNIFIGFLIVIIAILSINLYDDYEDNQKCIRYEITPDAIEIANAFKIYELQQAERSYNRLLNNGLDIGE